MSGPAPLHHLAPERASRGRLSLTRDELTAWGEAFGRAARPPLCVAIAGDLGAGKTTLVQAICRGYGVMEAVTSPTFALVHEYRAPLSPVFHLDLYRLQHARELAAIGWEDISAAHALVLIEWPERAAGLLPPDHVGSNCSTCLTKIRSGCCSLVNMLTLALDAAVGDATVAVLDGPRILASVESSLRDRTRETLLPTVMAALERAAVRVMDVEKVICGDGPGGFTALRLAAATAKGIVRGTGAELWVVPSLALIAAGAETALPAGEYLALLDALRGECYAASVTVAADGQVTRCDAFRRTPRTAALEYAMNEHLIPIGPAEQKTLGPHARGVARVASAASLVRRVSGDTWEPQYGRLAEAQVKWEAAHQRPLVVPQRSA